MGDNDSFADAVEDIVVAQDYEEIKKVRSLSQVILSHEARGSDRDVVFLQLKGWDHHADMKANLSEEFGYLDSALAAFEGEMKAHGLWEQVTVVVASEFGRTLTPNSSAGSDHGWGGHQMILGGDVKGQTIHGDYPSDLTDASPLSIGRGRVIPTLSWESLLNGPLEWIGVDTEESLDYCMPNRHGAGTPLLSMKQVFRRDRNLAAAST